jgi:hypothetical protein
MQQTFLPEHISKLPVIFMGDLNAHQWWDGSEATNTTPINSTRKHSERIVDWLEQYDFSLHNIPGTTLTSLVNQVQTHQ